MIETRQATLKSERMLGRGEAEFFASGRAPCVVALHGFSGTASELRPLLSRIADAGYAVDAAVLPGHGRLPHELQPVRFQEWTAAACERLRTALERYGAASLLGFSLGSLVAMHVAADGALSPGAAVSLMLLGNAVRLRPPAGPVLAVLSRVRPALPDLYLVKAAAGDALDKSALSALVTYDRHPLRAATEVYRAGRRAREEASRIEWPTLILHGRHDRVCSWHNATWLAGHIGARDVTLRIFERSAHLLACDLDRDLVADEVVAFLGRQAAGVPTGSARLPVPPAPGDPHTR